MVYTNSMKKIAVWLMCSALVLSGGAHLVGQCCGQDTVPVAIEMPMDCHTPADASQTESACSECMCDQCHTILSIILVNPVEPHYVVMDRFHDPSGRYLQVHAAAFHPPRQNA